jgi:hypothetical protein
MDAFDWFMVGTLTGLLITYTIVSLVPLEPNDRD